MADITLKGSPVKTSGDLPAVGTQAPAFELVKTDLSTATLDEFKGKKIVLNISPSIDTSICADSVRRFNEEANNLPDTVMLYISADLPFAHARFCEGEGLENVIPLSSFRSPEFGTNYGVKMTTGPFAGLESRAIVIVDKTGKIVYTDQTPDIVQDPSYEAALDAVKAID